MGGRVEPGVGEAEHSALADDSACASLGVEGAGEGAGGDALFVPAPVPGVGPAGKPFRAVGGAVRADGAIAEYAAGHVIIKADAGRPGRRVWEVQQQQPTGTWRGTRGIEPTIGFGGPSGLLARSRGAGPRCS